MAQPVWAGGNNLHIRNAELVAADDGYVLNADYDLNFSPEVEEAINKGVALNFLVEFQLTLPRRYWFDDEIVTTTRVVTLSYHALSRQYLVNRANHQQSFTTLQEAKEELTRLRGWQVIQKSMLKKGDIYQAALRVRLDQSRLPKALQVDVISSDAWDLVSQRHRWVPAISF